MIRLHTWSIIATAFVWMFCPLRAGAQEWRPVRGGILFGISGMALVEQAGAQPQEENANNLARTSFIVVHDNKNKAEGRVALVSIRDEESPQYTALQWPDDNLPVDLEALAAVPGQANSFMALAAGDGKLYHLRLNLARKAIEVVKVFNLPVMPANSNCEGFALQNINGVVLAVWAHRGANEQSAVLYWGLLDLTTYAFSQVRSAPLKAPWPVVNVDRATEVRHVSDIKVSATGALFVSSASDAGNDGPFDSALYLAGTFHVSNGQTNLIQTPAALLLNRFRYHKIEAFDLVPGESGGLVFATDDENMGSSIYLDW